MRRKRRPSRKVEAGIGAVEDMMLRQLGWYVRNCALSPAAGTLERLMLERLDQLKGDLDQSDVDAKTSNWTRNLGRRRREFRQILEHYASPPQGDESPELNVLFAREEFALDAIDADILLLLLRYENNGYLEQFADEVVHRLREPSRALSALLGIDRREAQRRTSTESPLISSGLLYVTENGCGGLAGETGALRMARSLRTIMHRSYASRREWVAAIAGEPISTHLAWEDFQHLSPACDLAANLLAGARKASAKGINILLYGPAGTGKTEFAKALAMRTGMSIWSVGEADEEGNEPGRDERLAALRCAQQLLAKRSDALVLLDEAEDVLVRWGASKVYINRIIEQNSAPILWTCNRVRSIDRAILRRMTLAIEIKTPVQPVRVRIWQRVLSEAQLTLEEGVAQRLSKRYAAPPAVAASATRAAALSGGGEAAIEAAMDGVLQLLNIDPAPPEVDASAFDPELVNCRDDLTALVEQLTRTGASRQWSLCIHGAPGTGKSRFARYLAARLGMEVLQQRASDLLSCWVGESEKRIAAAFETARRHHTLLVVDEADSLLSERREATQSWEVTQVNEMLTWMESHPLPFICTTNLMGRLDQASLRRFTLKLRFDPLNSDQAALAFERFFGVLPPRTLADDLTPGDFATVRRKRDLLGVENPSVLASWLDEEASAKGTRMRSIGFTAGQN